MKFDKSLLLLSVFVIGYIFGLKTTVINNRLIVPTRNYFFAERKRALTDYVEAPCPIKSLQLGYFGQSNSANYAEIATGIEIPSNLFQYDYKSSKCFRYKEPLLGGDGTGGNTITYAAVEIARKIKFPVVIIPFGSGGSSVLEWAFGYLSHEHKFVLAQVRKHGFSPGIFLWHQGESDARSEYSLPDAFARVAYFEKPNPENFHFGLPKNLYRSALREVVTRTLNEFPNAYFGIALVSRCKFMGVINQDEMIRSAQREVASSSPRTFVSADSDEIYGGTLRRDGCHFSAEGARRLSQQYLRTLSEKLDSVNELR